MHPILFKIKHQFRKYLVKRFFHRYVVNNEILQQDIEHNIQERACHISPNTLENKFNHLMYFYPDFAYIFFWRINQNRYRWKKYFTKELTCKIFRSSEIAGGLVCYHPFATVINAKQIGRNFQFRNGLTIGNKNNDNLLVPTIGDNVIVGAHVLIIGDITIGDNVTIGAGSVVVKDVPSNCVVAGNPARIIRNL